MRDAGLLVIGLLAIIVGAELLVRNAVRLAARLRVPPLVIGLTVVSLGTSSPELAIGVEAALRGAGGLSVGNIVGTDILTVLLIVGLTAVLRPLVVRSQVRRFDMPALALVAFLATLLGLDGTLGRLDGAVLLALGVAYTVGLFVVVRRDRYGIGPQTTRRFGARPIAAGRRGSAAWELVGTIGGIVVVVLAADLLVGGATGIAGALSVPEEVIGLTIVAVGTSAPEIATTVVATMRRERDIAIGNLVGSAMYNLVLILGVTLVIAEPAIAIDEHAKLDFAVMAGSTLACLAALATGGRVRRAEGVLLILGYAAYLTWTLVVRA